MREKCFLPKFVQCAKVKPFFTGLKKPAIKKELGPLQWWIISQDFRAFLQLLDAVWWSKMDVSNLCENYGNLRLFHPVWE